MAYSTLLDPVSKLISDNILATLRTITTPAYVTNLAKIAPGADGNSAQVRLCDSNVVVFSAWPAVALVPRHDEHNDDRTDIEQITQFYSLRIAVKDGADYGGPWRTQMRRILAEIRLALYVDERRGTWTDGRALAICTSFLATTIEDQGDDQGVHEAQMDFSVDYRTPYNDPTKPI